MTAKPYISASQFAARQATSGEPTVTNTRIIVFGWPDRRLPIELAEWLYVRYRDPRTGFHRDNLGVLAIQGLVQARNRAIRDYVLSAPEHYRWFLFVDRDVRPSAASDEMFGLTTDVRCCRVTTRNPQAWRENSMFHDPFWLARREVFEQTAAPWFQFPYTADGCDLAGCLCSSFRKQVLAAGFSISHGGFADHDSDQSWH